MDASLEIFGQQFDAPVLVDGSGRWLVDGDQRISLCFAEERGSGLYRVLQVAFYLNFSMNFTICP